MWAFVVVVFYEFPVERESSVFFVVDSEPAFDLALRGGFADAPEDVFDIVSRDSTRRRWIRLCGRSCVFNVYNWMRENRLSTMSARAPSSWFSFDALITNSSDIHTNRIRMNYYTNRSCNRTM